MKLQGCFAVKAGIDGKLDVARSTYLDTVNTINQQVEEYQEKFELNVKLHYRYITTIVKRKILKIVFS
jgi:DNA mismatch repair protein MSH4